MRRYINLLIEARGDQPSFAAIARSPLKYVESLLDVAIHYQEDIFSDFPTKRAIAAHLRETASGYLPLLKGGMLPIYRGLAIPAHWDPAVQGLGIYWTYALKAAFHRNDQYVVLHGTVAEREIDLWRTLLSEFTALTEREITLFPQSVVQLDKITRDGVPILPALAGHRYTANPAQS